MAANLSFDGNRDSYIWLSSCEVRPLGECLCLLVQLGGSILALHPNGRGEGSGSESGTEIP